ncbi:hypothetical protein [Lichenihabitans psoromatis]|nr:hypothetical protein [Lichenihabitans psoromatis]
MPVLIEIQSRSTTLKAASLSFTLRSAVESFGILRYDAALGAQHESMR